MNRILKRSLALLLSTAIILGVIPLTAASAASYDVTLDNQQNMLDVLALYRHVAGITSLADAAVAHADIDNSGTVNTHDALYLFLLISGAVSGDNSGDDNNGNGDDNNNDDSGNDSDNNEQPRITVRDGITDESVYMQNIAVYNTYTGRTFTGETKEKLQMAVAEVVRYEIGMSTFGEKSDEAWKALAVASYTLLARHCYNGSAYNISMSQDINLNNANDKRIYDAVGAVLGIKIAYNDASRSPKNQLCEIFYSASSAGVTCTTLNAWGYADLEYLPQVESPYDTDEWIKHYSAGTDSLTHRFSITMDELLACVKRLKSSEQVGYDTAEGKYSLYATEVTGPYWKTCNIYYINSSGKKTYISGVDIYHAVNYYGKPHCYSHAITVIDETDGTLTIETKGNGHGIGLSQYGVAGLANDAGWTYDRIIAHYYNISETSKWGLVGPKWT